MHSRRAALDQTSGAWARGIYPARVPPFGEVVERSLDLLERRGRVSHTALRLEFELDDEKLAALVEELVVVLGAADDDGRVLSGRAGPAQDMPAPPVLASGSPALAHPAAPAADLGAPGRPKVAVLLCELAMTPAPEALGAATRSAVTTRAHAICDEVARRFDARARPWVGDGVAIFLGHPRCHDDEAQRAVRCGWELIRALDAARGVLDREHGVRVRARVGIATGPSGADAGDPFGPIAQLAAGVQAAGAADGVTVDATTHALVDAPASFEDLGAHRLTRSAAPVTLHRLVAPLDEASGERRANAAAPLAGRGAERALLRALAERASAGTRSAVLLRGPAGVGKTRLAEALRAIAAQELGMAVLRCECSPYHRGSPLHPILEGLRREGIATPPRDDAASSGRARREELAALVGTLGEQARRRPLLLVVEDLHWADPSTLELLGVLIEGAPELPLLLALTARQDLPLPPGAALQLLDLAPLGDEDMLRVVAAAAAGGALGDGVAQELAERAGGSPLLAQELTRTMLAMQDSENREMIPATLYGCLMARLNRDGAARSVAQLAATIGREFDLSLLRALGTLDEAELDWGLERLVADGVVSPTADGTYAFRHALLQDAARSSLRRGALRAHNLRIARTLLQRFPHVAAAEPERVARHLEYAGELVESVAHWQLAGLDAQRHAAHREAAGHFERGLMLTGRMASTPQRVASELSLRVLAARALAAIDGWEHPAAVAHRVRADALGALVEHGPQSLRATLGLTRQRLAEGRVTEALALARVQARAASAPGEAELQLEAACELGGVLVLAGQPVKALLQLDRALALHDPGRDREHALRFGRDPAATALSHRALALACRADGEGARAAAASAARVLRARPHPFSQAWVHCGAATAAVVCDEPTVAGREAAIALEIATREGFAGWHAHASVLHGWSRVLAGEHAAGHAELQGGVAAWIATGAAILRPWHACLLSAALLLCREPDAALLAVDDGLAAVAGGERWCEPELHRCRAQGLQALGRRSRANASAQVAVVCARKLGSPAWERRALGTLAGLGDMSRAA
jgi:hypothetical protein